MKNLIGLVPRDTLSLVTEATRTRFKNASNFRTPEALILYEQRVLPTDELFQICQEEYDEKLVQIEPQYIPKAVIEGFEGSGMVPLKVNTIENELIVGKIPEMRATVFNYESFKVTIVDMTIYDYIAVHTNYYGEPDFLLTIPVTDKLDFIVAEAIELGAADITITNVLEGAKVYYNVRKRKVNSRRVLTRDNVEEMALILANRAHQAVDHISVDPLYLAVRLDQHNRGRICINKNFYGVVISMRALSDDPLNMTLQQLNIKQNAIDFIESVVMRPEPGLRVWIGETMSGKNTTICCVLSTIAKLDRYKIVSVEQPVETPIPNVEQLEVATEDEFHDVTGSLVRQNPDIVYIVEMNQLTAMETIRTANTSKAVYSTIHANSISELPSRIMDLTGLPLSRVIMSLHSAVYQKLVRDEEKDKLYPVLKCVEFSRDFKQRLYGKELYEVQQLIQEVEDKWES